MAFLLDLIEQYGLFFVFGNVLLEQLGAPIPAYPTLVITGALLERGEYSAPMLLLTGVIAALIADYAWYMAGRRYGGRVMAKLCRISLSPDSCVRQTEGVYMRYGPASLIVAKFIPGFASVASALAGAIGTRSGKFILFDTLGAVLWSGSAIFLGSLFSSAVSDLLDILASLGKWGVMLVALAFAVYLAKKWWQRYMFLKDLRMARITVSELDQLLKSGNPPTIIDVRTGVAQQGGRIPGAMVMSVDDDLSALVINPETNSEVIIYCACPNEASAARLAKKLMQRGYTRVRPLTGGIDAWLAAGYAVEQQ
ncbi:MAG TPA: DedA family protein/thiosulfate sulfurtransferase GlpE [Oxalicibacterium sp.]|uniref:DedA family protein/thiosulfate sulfurtransferase GlpE n=1 Tax=Oxalicibacterium sp. TaxID=2766525 RepID=UPI002CFB15C6|nr:DedA family protein/thiosulfate sulfurtransferase GlpE [Oxalicibacterium sp.]HWU98121.1 DedA family protein/thiosulfate sulfurtransferase GlpE [Oxalicibacterium sp.]